LPHKCVSTNLVKFGRNILCSPQKFPALTYKKNPIVETINRFVHHYAWITRRSQQWEHNLW